MSATGNGASLQAGTMLQHKTGGTATLARRKEDGTGWWCAEGGGLSDRALTSGDWDVAGWTAPPRPEPPARYRPVSVTSISTSVCKDCGAVVCDMPVHDRWHDRVGGAS